MIWFLAIVAVIVVTGVVLVATGKAEPMTRPEPDRPEVLPPSSTGGSVDRILGADDIRRVRFSVAVRGYRMSEVDALLERVAKQLDQFVGPADDVRTEGTEKDPHELD